MVFSGFTIALKVLFYPIKCMSYQGNSCSQCVCILLSKTYPDFSSLYCETYIVKSMERFPQLSNSGKGLKLEKSPGLGTSCSFFPPTITCAKLLWFLEVCPGSIKEVNFTLRGMDYRMKPVPVCMTTKKDVEIKNETKIKI